MTTELTAVLCCYNEADRLAPTWETLDFCCELIVVDMGSTDGSREVAEGLGARILEHPLLPFPNLARQHGIRHATNEWVVSIDLDERFPKHELPKVLALIDRRPDLAAIRLPWQYYFKGRRVQCTVFGREAAAKCALVHRDRIVGTPYVHKELLCDGPDSYTFPRREIDPIDHFWASSYRELYTKNRRYLAHEGEARYVLRGQRFSWLRLLKQTTAVMKMDLIDYRGWRGGPMALMLTTYHAWYVAMAWLSLRRYEAQLSDHGPRVHGTSA